MQLTQPATQLFTHLGVQRAEGFIQQQNLWFNRQRARQRHALLLPAGQLRRKAIRQMRKLYHLQQFGHFRFDGRRIWALAARQYGQAKRNIVEYVHMAKQRVMLEHKAHFTVPGMQTAYVGAVKADVPAGLMLQPGDNTQQRGFTGARRPEQRHHLSGRDIQRDIIQHLGATKGLLNIGNLNAHDFPPDADVFPDFLNATAPHSSKTGSKWPSASATRRQ